MSGTTLHAVYEVPTPWLFRPEAIDGEILSSYLCRIARANGVSPSRFYSFHFPGFPVWNRDIDRSASDIFISEIAVRCDTSKAAIGAMMLRSFESSFHHSEPTRHKTVIGLSPWINAAGVYHRTRKGFAMQYCPHCMVLNHAYKTIWRLSFVTVCELHHRPLLDCCPHCGAQIVFHRNEVFHANCHRCGMSLLKMSQVIVDDDDLRVRLELQTKLLGAVQKRKILVGGETLTSRELFMGLAILMRAVKAKLRLKRGHQPPLSAPYANCPTVQIELLRVPGRARQCHLLADMLNDWPNQFLGFAVAHHLTQTAFKKEECPIWLHRVVSMLPTGTTWSKTVREAPIRKILRSLHRHKYADWRTERAKLLLQGAKVRI